MMVKHLQSTQERPQVDLVTSSMLFHTIFAQNADFLQNKC